MKSFWSQLKKSQNKNVPVFPWFSSSCPVLAQLKTKVFEEKKKNVPAGGTTISIGENRNKDEFWGEFAEK